MCPGFVPDMWALYLSDSTRCLSFIGFEGSGSNDYNRSGDHHEVLRTNNVLHKAPNTSNMWLRYLSYIGEDCIPDGYYDLLTLL